MTAESTTSQRKWLHIWVILLCLGIVFQAAFFVWAFTEGTSRREADTAQIQKNEEAIELLCDRGYLLNDMIIANRVLVQQNPQLKGKDTFLLSLEVAYAQILDQLTSQESPCVRP